jgi:hypothetical protein
VRERYELFKHLTDQRTPSSHAAHRRPSLTVGGASFHQGTNAPTCTRWLRCPLCSVGAAWGGHTKIASHAAWRLSKRDTHSSSFRNWGKHIVSRQRSPYPLERELSHRLDCDSILNRHQHTGTNQDLTGLGFVAKARGDVGHRPDGGVVETALKADGVERGKAVRDADAEANIVPEPSLPLGQRSDTFTHIKSHQHSLERRVIYRYNQSWPWSGRSNVPNDGNKARVSTFPVLRVIPG